MTTYSFYTSPFYQAVENAIQENNIRMARFQEDIARREANRQLYLQRQQAATRYVNQLSCLPMYMNNAGQWHVPYAPMEANYIGYWLGSYYVPQAEQQRRQEYLRSCFKDAIDVVAHMTKDQYPVFSLFLDGIGLMTADSFSEAIMKAASMIDTVMGMEQSQNQYCYN